MNKLLLALVAIAALIGGFYWFNSYIYHEKQGPTDYKNATYVIDGEPVTLVNGRAESEAAPGSASKIVTTYFGNEATGDLNGDTLPDVAFLLTQDTGGSGTFYYVVAALQTAAGTYNGSQALLLGDRIAPQTTEYHGFSGIPGGYIVVNYADRAPGEPMTAQPSMGKSLWLKLDPATMQWGEIVQNFEGEADPSQMTLGMKTWVWQRTVPTSGEAIVPQKADAFTLTFSDGQVGVHTDCNSGSGTYSASDSSLSFGAMAATLMYCEGSQESEFFSELADTSAYHFTSKGELILELKDGGAMTLR